MWRCGLTFCLILIGINAAKAAEFSLQSHRAIYELKLKRAQDGGSISGLKGRLVMEWSEDCEGYILNQRMLTQVTDTRGQQALNDFRITSWESRDGLKFRYSSRNEIDGKLIEEITGQATLSGARQAGVARFRKPEVEERKLPKGTVFPTEQLLMLLRMAEAGERTGSVLLFDGSRIDSLYESTSVIGKPKPALTPSASGIDAALAGQRSWPVQLAYFPLHAQPDQAPGTPEFEVGFRLFQSGIATELVIDYGNFALDGTLSHLEPLPRVEC